MSMCSPRADRIALSITEYSENKELAAAFLTFLAQAENQDVFVELYQTQGSNHKDGDPSKIQNLANFFNKK